jgi:alkylation response protein AidB-like acyl-CoA dehydrogenase
MADVDLDAFRREIRAWLEESCPPSMRTRAPESEDVWGGRRAVFPSADARLWLERMAGRGYTAPTWPKEYGGAGLRADEARVLEEEQRRLGCRMALKSFGIWMLGPVLLRHGNEEQRREHLPKIARGEIRWCQGYSEPSAGSDLASLRTRAVRDGDAYVVNGHKVWTSHADKADWMFCLVRTDPGAPKREGISFLLIDMSSPGITVRPIPLISGASPFCETLFENVRVPARNRVGGENEGWRIALELLEHERSLISRMRADNVDEDEPLEPLAVRTVGLGGDGRLADPVARDRLAQLAIEFLASRLTMARSSEAAKAGRPPGPETSMFKYVGTELNKRRRELKVLLHGFQGLGWEGEGFSAQELTHTREWLRSRASSIEGGTSEIQLNVIAKRVLGLPDDGGAPDPALPVGGATRVTSRPDDVQEEIRREARDFVRRRMPIAHLRKLRDDRDPIGFSREIWREMAALGFAGITLPPSCGGAGLGYAELGLVLEECGRTLAPTPFLSTVVLGASLLERAGGWDESLRAIAAGERIVALAHEEGRRHDPYRVAATLRADGDSFVLDGSKVFVLDGHVADLLIVVARTSGAPGDRDGLTLIAIPASAAGVTIQRTLMVDSRNAARVGFEAVRVPRGAVLGAIDRGADLLDPALARATVAITAEMLGGSCEAFERTVAYLKEREQFGKPIGTFQALKHRAAQLFCELELARSLVLDALRAVDAGRDDVALVASAAKTLASDTFVHVANEAIQLHGGVGVTDELDIGFFLKRARACELTLGAAPYHRSRWATLSGY